ncbi:MAG: hypothetical protein VB949_02555 [Pseudomonadales bacterium]
MSNARASAPNSGARARDSLKRLRKRRRGGYSLSAASALDAEQADLKSRVSQYC